MQDMTFLASSCRVPKSHCDTPSALCVQWRRSVTLVDINRLIEDVQTLNDMPPRLQKLEDAKVRQGRAGIDL